MFWSGGWVVLCKVKGVEPVDHPVMRELVSRPFFFFFFFWGGVESENASGRLSR